MKNISLDMFGYGGDTLSYPLKASESGLTELERAVIEAEGRDTEREELENQIKMEGLWKL